MYAVSYVAPHLSLLSLTEAHAHAHTHNTSHSHNTHTRCIRLLIVLSSLSRIAALMDGPSGRHVSACRALTSFSLHFHPLTPISSHFPLNPISHQCRYAVSTAVSCSLHCCMHMCFHMILVPIPIRPPFLPSHLLRVSRIVHRGTPLRLSCAPPPLPPLLEWLSHHCFP